MKNFLYIILAIVLFSACEKDEYTQKQTAQDADSPLTRASMISTFSYDSIKAKWDTYTSLVERYEVCQIPEKILPKLPTDLLVRLCLEHPLMINYLAYNNEVMGVESFYDNYNGLQALCKREDAGSALLTALADTTLSTFEFGFIEILLGSGKVSLSDSLMNSSLYSNAIQTRLGYLNENSHKYSSFTSNRNLFLQASVNAKRARKNISSADLFNTIVYSGSEILTRAAGDILDSIYVYTSYGQVVPALMLREYTSFESNEVDEIFLESYPNAIMIEPSSHRYNCHAYAWSLCSNNPVSCWINGGISSDTDKYVSRYWTEDEYGITAIASAAERVYYQGGDHSAVVSTTYDDKYESKWGNGPLMAHAPADCPYNSSNLLYLRKCDMVKYLSGNDIPSVGNTYRYTLPTTNINLTTGDWLITDHKGNNFSNITYSTGRNYIDITFLRSGEYTVTCNIYYGSRVVGRAECCMFATN